MYLALFPLQSVFFPGEKIPLHIFETRYRQLIQDCKDDAMNFGIPVYLDDLMKYGVEVQLEEIIQLYPGGEMDVICKAKSVFKMISFDKMMESKPYAGGEVIFLDNILDANPEQTQLLKQAITSLYQIMGVPPMLQNIPDFDSFSLAHKIGLSKAQEYRLLQMEKESERLDYLLAHVQQVISVLKEVDRTKELIQLNGHFKNFDPLDFEDFKP